MSIWWSRSVRTGDAPPRRWLYSIHVSMMLIVLTLALLVGLSLPLLARLFAWLQS